MGRIVRSVRVHWIAEMEGFELEFLNRFEWVEGTYLHNRAKYIDDKLSEMTMTVPERNMTDVGRELMQEMIDACLANSDVKLVNLDLGLVYSS